MKGTDNTEPDGDAARDARGRFAAGNKLGRGNGMAQAMQRHRQAVADAITPTAIFETLSGLLAAARCGDPAAARILLEYGVGKPRQQPLVVELDLPRLDSAEAVANALRAVTAAVAGGELDVEAGQQVAGLVAQVATATAWQEVADRVAALERRAP